MTNLTFYQELCDETLDFAESYENLQSRKLILTGVKRVSNLIDQLTIPHRIQRRSINAIGTLIKWVAGNPDHNDYEEMLFKVNQLIESENDQRRINSELSDKILEMTLKINNLIEDRETRLEFLLQRTKHMYEDLQNAIMSLNLARLKIVNLALLTHDETLQIINNDKNDVIIGDIVMNSKINVFLTNDLLIFAIEYPLIKMTCNHYFAKPVIHENKIIKIKNEHVGYCLGIYKNLILCNKTLDYYFCRISYEQDCFNNLILNSSSICNTTTPNSKPIEQIDDGIVLINNAEVIVTEENHIPIKINGTYLITFDSNVTINNMTFENNRGKIIELAKRQRPHQVTYAYHEPSQEDALDILHIQNARKISKLQYETGCQTAIITAIGVLIIILTIFKCYKICQNRTMNIDDEQQKYSEFRAKVESEKQRIRNQEVSN